MPDTPEAERAQDEDLVSAVISATMSRLQENPLFSAAELDRLERALRPAVPRQLDILMSLMRESEDED